MLQDAKVMISEAELVNLSAMTVIEKTILNKKLKTELAYVKSATDNIEMGCKRKLTCKLLLVSKSHSTITGNGNPIDISVEAHSVSDYGRFFPSNCENDQASFDSRSTAGINIQKCLDDSRLSNAQMLVTDKPTRTNVVGSAYKCGSAGILKCHKEKSQRIDSGRMQHCAGILKKLMTHQYGWVFNQPVDPVKLNIPDYFYIITKPMDLGTIKHKLEIMQYLNPIEFAEDVKLTFANAMRYNPPSNDVHIMAKKLNNVFSLSWKSLEARYREQDLDTSRSKTDKKARRSKQMPCERASYGQGSNSRKVMSSLESQDMKNICGQGLAHSLRKGSERSLGMSSVYAPNTVYKSKPAGGQEDNGAVSKFEDQNDLPSTCPPGPPSTSGKGDEGPLYDEQLSPNKALRAAILKSRFADTIIKAQQKTLLDNGEKGDALRMQQEREKLEKKQQEEKARIEAQIQAAEAAVKMKEAELRLQREKEREAARLAVQNMEKTVDIDENYALLKDLQSLGYVEHNEMSAEMANFMHGVELLGGSRNPLEQLGLFMKDEDIDEVDEWISTSGDDGNIIEEGEIGSI